MALRRVLAVALAALAACGLSAAVTFVAAGGTKRRPQTQMRATRANDKSDNFIDKAFTVMPLGLLMSFFQIDI